MEAVVAVTTESDPCQQAKAVMGAAGIALAQRRADEQKSMDLTTDGRFHLTLRFETPDQRDTFLDGLADKFGLKSSGITPKGSCGVVLILDTFDQKQALLNGMRTKYGLQYEGDIFQDGRRWADALGIAIPEVATKMPGLFRVDPKYAAMVMGDDD